MKNDKNRGQEHCSLLTAHFETKVLSVVKDYLSDFSFLIAVSGGADSMALLAVLCNLRTENEDSAVPLYESLHVLHIEHGLRGQESLNDAEFVRTFCEERSVPCTIASIPEGKVADYAKNKRTGLEAAARHFRRIALQKKAKELDKPEKKTLILTAHTKDDALELSLMRIFRGSGPEGLSAMPVKRGRFLRPLLDLTRVDIISYLKEKNIPWRDDSTNTDEKFLRNKIRHKLIPFLDEVFFPSCKGAAGLSISEQRAKNSFNWRKGISEMSSIQSSTAKFISSEVKKRIIWEQEDNYLVTDEANFFLQPEIIKVESIFLGINLLSSLCSPSLCAPVRGFRRSVIRQFCEGKARAYDLGAVRIVRKKGKITLLLK